MVGARWQVAARDRAQGVGTTDATPEALKNRASGTKESLRADGERRGASRPARGVTRGNEGTETDGKRWWLVMGGYLVGGPRRR
jgi:hypothetical protein